MLIGFSKSSSYVDWQIHYIVTKLDRELEEVKQVPIAIDWFETINVVGQWLSVNLLHDKTNR